MGGLCKSDSAVSPPTTTTVVQGTQIPQWVSEGGQKLFDQASSLAQQPYQPYSGARVAPFTADENTAFADARTNQGSYQPYLDQATGQLSKASQTWNPQTAQQYMDPYATQVSDVVARKVSDAYDQQKMANNARAVQTGAFGGARQGVNDAIGQKNYLQTLGDVYSTGLSNAYNAGGQLFNADKTSAINAAQGYGAEGQLAQQLGSNDVASLMTTGGVQRQQGQLGLDTAYQDFQAQQAYPYQQTNFALGALAGTPYDKQQTSSTTGTQIVQSPSIVGQLGGLGLTGVATYGLLKSIGS